MTENQQKLLDFIRARIETTGGSPTYEEMRQHLGCASKSLVARVVESLVEQGKLYRMAKRHRGLALTPHNLSSVPTADLTAELARRERSGGQ